MYDAVIWSISNNHNSAFRVSKALSMAVHIIFCNQVLDTPNNCNYFFLFIFLDFGYCSPFDNKVDDCINGQCVVYPDQYGSYQSTCKCKDGFYGEKCDGG